VARARFVAQFATYFATTPKGGFGSMLRNAGDGRCASDFSLLLIGCRTGQSSADHRSLDGHLQRSKKQVLIQGLNRNCNHDLKNLFKSAALVASRKPVRFEEFYAAPAPKV
jgi:hypothetical protein